MLSDFIYHGCSFLLILPSTTAETRSCFLAYKYSTTVWKVKTISFWMTGISYSEFLSMNKKEIDVNLIPSNQMIADSLTKAAPLSSLKKLQDKCLSAISSSKMEGFMVRGRVLKSFSPYTESVNFSPLISQSILKISLIHKHFLPILLFILPTHLPFPIASYLFTIFPVSCVCVLKIYWPV
ncbi:hypothetical protein VP01_1836g2 [Puccinia sorghi]|uniref:Uncharacterized protein n=1 Tax=Puccinia sorghi TaxID=27349 RepID=A0A0L6VDQ9_9BASI|nr:hypothetical protein VP01_1836g2 [Puccinia sorghi]